MMMATKDKRVAHDQSVVARCVLESQSEAGPVDGDLATHLQLVSSHFGIAYFDDGALFCYHCIPLTVYHRIYLLAHT